ncbi:MAG: type II secretion system protein [Chloroflexota bacterium]
MGNLKTEKGATLIEAIVALALLGIVGAAFLSALATSSTSRLIADEHVSARVLAESQMEEIKQRAYAFAYDPVPVGADYPGYSANIDVENLRNGSIQKITVTISHHDHDITSLESYKVSR